MELGTTRLVIANHGAVTMELPTSQGSIRTVYARLADSRSSVDGCGSGEKIRRKVLSAFKCRIVTDMLLIVSVEDCSYVMLSTRFVLQALEHEITPK